MKNLPIKQETPVRLLGQEYLLGKEMTAHSSILAWEIPWTEEPGRYSPWGRKRVRHKLASKEQENNKDLLYSTGSYIQYPVLIITSNGKRIYTGV